MEILLILQYTYSIAVYINIKSLSFFLILYLFNTDYYLILIISCFNIKNLFININSLIVPIYLIFIYINYYLNLVVSYFTTRDFSIIIPALKTTQVTTLIVLILYIVPYYLILNITKRYADLVLVLGISSSFLDYNLNIKPLLLTLREYFQVLYLS